MRYFELFESPIGNLEVHNMDVPGTFPDIDRKLLTSEKHIKNIRYRFQNVPYLFHLYFINRNDVQYTKTINNTTIPSFTDEFRNDLKDLSGETTSMEIKRLFNIDVKPDSKAITVFYCSNANIENSISMTPWIIAHRFAHAVMDKSIMFKNEIYTLGELINKMRIFKQTINGHFLKAKDFFTFRSARNDSLLYGEHLVELITQFIMTGRNKFEINPSKIELFSPDIIPTIQPSLDKFEIEISKCIDNMLDKCIGKIFITV